MGEIENFRKDPETQKRLNNIRDAVTAFLEYAQQEYGVSSDSPLVRSGIDTSVFQAKSKAQPKELEV